MPKRIDKLTEKQKEQMAPWADKWIEIGLRCGDADRPRFENAVRTCYRFAQLKPPKRIVWTTSPLAVVLASPIAAHLLDRGSAVNGAVRGAVRSAVGGAVRGAVGDAVRINWVKYIGGQFWVGGYWWGPSYTSYFREICNLELPGDLWERGKAYEASAESACWWWPHREFVIVSERPLLIRRELVDQAKPRGPNSHRLHCEDGPAVAFRDGWGVWAWHGVRVPQHVIERPASITIEEVRKEENAEVRRVMIERMGWERFCSEAKMRVIHRDTLQARFPAIPVSERVHESMLLVTEYREGEEVAELLQADEFRDFEDRPLKFVRLTDPSTGRQYLLRVWHDNTRAYEAVAKTFSMSEKEYRKSIEAHS